MMIALPRSLRSALAAATIALSAGVLGLGTAQAAPLHDVTPDVIFGSGNANGGFNVVTVGSLELGLRAKLRYNQSGNPENTFPRVGTTNVYRFREDDGVAPANRALWSFEWSVNTNVDGNGVNLNAYTYQIALTGPDGYSFTYNPFASLRDVSLGTNSTGNGGGVGRGFWDSLFGTIPNNFNVAQESENIGFTFFNNSNPQALGQYSVMLSVLQGGQTLASNKIYINVAPIPVPAALPLLAGGLALMGFMGWRRRQIA